MVYTPPVDGVGSPYASFDFQVQDTGGTAHGGVELSFANTITLDVTPADITSDLVVHLEFSEGFGTTALDSTAYGNDAYLTGTQDWVSGPVGGGFHFDYSNGEDFFEIHNAASVENLQEGSFTLAAWFKADDLPPASDPYGIIVKEGMHTGVWYNSSSNSFLKLRRPGPAFPGLSAPIHTIQAVITISPLPSTGRLEQ